MNETPFYTTRMGARFYENTVPELVRQLARLNDNLERLIQLNDKEAPDADHRQEEEKPPHR